MDKDPATDSKIPRFLVYDIVHFEVNYFSTKLLIEFRTSKTNLFIS